MVVSMNRICQHVVVVLLHCSLIGDYLMLYDYDVSGHDDDCVRDDDDGGDDDHGVNDQWLV